jgi:hypothetical protein
MDEVLREAGDTTAMLEWNEFGFRPGGMDFSRADCLLI